MSQLSSRVVFSIARPVRTHQNPIAFFRNTRYRLSATPPKTRRTPTTNPSNSHQHLSRPFSTSPPHLATVTLQNPRTDDDGNDMSIEISDRAAKRLKQITTSPTPKNTLVPSSSSLDSHLRVTVTSGGCHGFQYLMSLENASRIDHDEDTVFAADGVGDGNSGKAEVVMDQASLELLKGSTVDFTTELIGSQFKIVGNPRAKSSCGCGTSFDVE